MLAWNPSENCRFTCGPGRSQHVAEAEEVGESRHNEKRVFLSRAKERIPERGHTVRWQPVMFPELVKDIRSAICSKDDK